MVVVQVREQHGVDRPGVRGVGHLAQQVRDAVAQHGSVISARPAISISTVAWPSQVTFIPGRARLAHPRHADTRRMPLGPLQVMVVNFEDTNFTGEIEAELIRLEETGTLRVLDIIFVAKSLEGEIEVIRTDESTPAC